MFRRVVIAGAGGFGRGVFSWLEQSPAHRRDWQITEVVFIDDYPPGPDLPAAVVASIQEYVPEPNDAVIVAVGVPKTRRAIVEHLSERGVRFHTFVDDRAAIAKSVEIGEGAVICPGSVISAGSRVGEHVHINFNCSVGHDTKLGAFTTLSPAVNIMGSTQVGHDVFFGGSAAVLPRINVDSHVVAGAGAVVVRSVESGKMVVGNPASDIEHDATSPHEREVP